MTHTLSSNKNWRPSIQLTFELLSALILPIRISFELFSPHNYFKKKSYKLYQQIHSIFTCPCYFDASESQLAPPATMMPRVMWAEVLQWAPPRHPGGSTGTVYLMRTFLAPGLASPHSLQHSLTFLAFRISCKSHPFDWVEEKSLEYWGLEDNNKGYAWVIPVLYWQLGKKITLSQAEQQGQSLTVNNAIIKKLGYLRLTRHTNYISNPFP